VLVVALALLLHGVAGVSANAAAPAVAAEPEWKQTNGPGGGSVDALIIDPLHPGTLYRGSNATIGMGVYKTLPGGRLWRPASVGIPSPEVVALAIDPLDPTTLYAGTLETGVFKSSDGALTWMAANDGLPIDGTAMLRRLVIDPSTPSTIYVGLGDQFGPDGGVFKSTDGGDTWARSSLGLPVITKFEALAMAPSDPSVLYASFESAFDLLVYKTVDSGASWTPANNGLLTNASVEDLAIDPTDPLTLYAGTVDAAKGLTAVSIGLWTAEAAGCR
jgi:hypothetical protein